MGEGRQLRHSGTSTRTTHRTGLPTVEKTSYRPYERFAIIAGIAYPYGVKTADPDNAAETVNTILHSGTRIGAWPDVNSQHCRGVAFVRLPNLMTGNHMVRLFVFPVAREFSDWRRA